MYLDMPSKCAKCKAKYCYTVSSFRTNSELYYRENKEFLIVCCTTGTYS